MTVSAASARDQGPPATEQPPPSRPDPQPPQAVGLPAEYRRPPAESGQFSGVSGMADQMNADKLAL